MLANTNQINGYVDEVKIKKEQDNILSKLMKKDKEHNKTKNHKDQHCNLSDDSQTNGVGNKKKCCSRNKLNNDEDGYYGSYN